MRLNDALSLVGLAITAAESVFNTGISDLVTGDSNGFLSESFNALGCTFVAPTDSILVGLAKALQRDNPTANCVRRR
jgi:hypothetical protein